VRTIFHVEFGVHVPADSIASMVTGLGSHGLLRRDGDSRRYLIDVPRPARAVAMKKQLRGYQSYGFLTWQAHESEES
jgi:hypothetical protein